MQVTHANPQRHEVRLPEITEAEVQTTNRANKNLSNISDKQQADRILKQDTRNIFSIHNCDRIIIKNTSYSACLT